MVTKCLWVFLYAHQIKFLILVNKFKKNGNKYVKNKIYS